MHLRKAVMRHTAPSRMLIGGHLVPNPMLPTHWSTALGGGVQQVMLLAGNALHLADSSGAGGVRQGRLGGRQASLALPATLASCGTPSDLQAQAVPDTTLTGSAATSCT